ncbi:MAG: L-lactate dehydrogenase [Candidatus Geothermincolia bacterium]
MERFRSGKVTIIGAGLVGATSAYAMMIAGIASEIVLVDTDERKLRGQVMDLDHGINFVPPVRVRAGSYEDCADSRIAVISAGASQRPHESRLDLLKRNIDVFSEIVPRVAEQNPDIVLVIVTNPVDVLTFASLKLSGLPRERVIGSGTLLDSARFRYLIAHHCGVATPNVHTYIIGEHGDSELPTWSITYIAGMPLERFCVGCGRGCGAEERHSLFEQARGAAYRIISDKGATYYAIGLSVRRLIEAVLRDENSILPVSTLMRGELGVEGVCLSLPSVMNLKGVARVLELPLDESEVEAFRQSAAIVAEAQSEADL